jgi:hypothetical protein
MPSSNQRQAANTSEYAGKVNSSGAVATSATN